MDFYVCLFQTEELRDAPEGSKGCILGSFSLSKRGVTPNSIYLHFLTVGLALSS